eukprot:PhM_4_TR11444/c0_g1_i1/m.63819/K08857/NEK1_4_5; NIMA (never in mitosis gene a)-related kinase 1/4/5
MDSFEVLSKIGQGTCASVFLIATRDTGERLVLKRIPLLPPSAGPGAAFRLPPQQEVDIMKSLPYHPAICALTSSFEVGASDLCVVMEYCEKGDLSVLLSRCRQVHNPMPEKVIGRIFAQMALAVSHLHDHGIAHRDVKTQNVYLRSDMSVALGDLGISVDINNVEHNPKLLQKVLTLGTPLTMAPEVQSGEWKGKRGVLAKADMWGVGCVLYELVTLKAPFEGRDLHQLMMRVMRGSFSPIPENYSPELGHLISLLLKKNPAQRLDASGTLRHPWVAPYVKEFLESLHGDEHAFRAVGGQLRRHGIDHSGWVPTAGTPPPHHHENSTYYDSSPLDVSTATGGRCHRQDNADAAAASSASAVPTVNRKEQVLRQRKASLQQKEAQYLADLARARQEHYDARAHVKDAAAAAAMSSPSLPGGATPSRTSQGNERVVRLQREVEGYQTRIQKQFGRLESVAPGCTLRDTVRAAEQDTSANGLRALVQRAATLRRTCESKLGREHFSTMYAYLHKRSKGLVATYPGDIERDLGRVVKGPASQQHVQMWTYVDELVYLDHAMEIEL